MTGLALRLSLAGGGEALRRLATIASAVAVGVALLLVTLAGANGVRSQNDRNAWLLTGTAPAQPLPPGSRAPDPLWWMLRVEAFDGHDLIRVDVAGTGGGAPVPPGLSALPGPGEIAASPALVALLAEVPDAQLGGRFDGRLVATVGDEALPSPDTLLVVVGRTVDELAADGRAVAVEQISTTSPAACSSCAAVLGIGSDGMLLILAVIAATLVLPVVVFVGSATRLSAARREQRFAALRLLGATPRQVAVVAAVEAAVAALAGTVLGFAGFALARSRVATIGFTGDPLFPSDLVLTAGQVAAVALGVPLAAALAALVALRQVQVSPLGVQRRATPAPPRPWRVVPLVAGIGELLWFAVLGRPTTSGAQVAAYTPGMVLILVGLVAAGPWLTMVGARLLARRSGRPEVLIASRRLADDPRAAFRAISGVVLALCVASGAVGVITTVVAGQRPADDDGTVLVQGYTSPEAARPAGLAPAVLRRLAAVPGVSGVTQAHVGSAPADDLGPPPSLVSCAELAGTPSLGRCPAGASVVEVQLRFAGGVIDGAPSLADVVWPAAALHPEALEARPLSTVVVATDGSRAAVEGARTVLLDAVPERFPPETVEEINRHGSEDLAQFRRLATVVVLVGLVVAGCSLAVGVAAGLTERRRPFSLLRLTGVPVRLLRRVVVLETVVPLLLTAAVAIGSGFSAAQLFARAQLDRSLTMPGPAYAVAVVVGLSAALTVVASTLPLIDRVTGPDVVRNDG